MKFKNIIFYSATIVAFTLLVNSCKAVKIPENVKVVDDFKVDKYLGTWYEIARFDFKYEKDMNNVTANYSLNSNGTIKVVNKGFDYKKNKWKESIGKAKFVDNVNKGALKVSFFGPFYGGYNVVMVDKEYKNALIFGEDTNYIWILSRNKSISPELKELYLKTAKEAGYDLSRLVWTEQN